MPKHFPLICPNQRQRFGTTTVSIVSRFINYNLRKNTLEIMKDRGNY